MKSILELPSDSLEVFLAWARYLHWSDLHRERMDKWISESHDMGSPLDKWHFIGLLSQWYSSLWVVVEGWREARLEDRVIDDFLKANTAFCDLLRRYRNGVYHFQPSLLEPRFKDFLEESENNAPRVDYIHHEFLRYFNEMFSNIPNKTNEELIRNTMFNILGWFPTGTIEAEMRGLEGLCDQAEVMVAQFPNSSSPESRQLLELTSKNRQSAREHFLKYQASRELLGKSLNKTNND